MTIGSISFQSNISLILLSIIIILAIIYFYLDTRKLKLKIDELESNNDKFIKEFENLNKGLHAIVSNFNVNSNITSNISKVSENNVNNVEENIKDNIRENEATINVWIAPMVNGRLYFLIIIPVKII